MGTWYISDTRTRTALYGYPPCKVYVHVSTCTGKRAEVEVKRCRTIARSLGRTHPARSHAIPAASMESDSDYDTVHGLDTDTGTETESAASSYASARNKKKKDRKKAAAAARKAAAAAGPTSGATEASSSTSEPKIVVEYVSTRDELANPVFAGEFAEVFGHFSTAEELLNGAGAADAANGSRDAEGDAKAKAAAAAAAAVAANAEEEKELSKRAKKRMKRLTIAELKQLCVCRSH